MCSSDLVFMAIPRAILVGTRLVFPVDVVGNGVRVRAQLDDTEGRTGTGEGVAHACRADERVYPVRETALGRLCLRSEGRQQGKNGTEERFEEVHGMDISR